MKNYYLFICLFSASIFAQQATTWTKVEAITSAQSKNTMRESFPKSYALFAAPIASMKLALQAAPNKMEASQSNVIISVPNTQGSIEHFRVFEYSNFSTELQARFPEIRSYIGVGIEDPVAQIRFSMDQNGFQAMVFRVGKRNEFIEHFSADGSVYAVFESSREKGKLPFTCSTIDTQVATDLAGRTAQSSSGELLTFRLALSCNAEYTTYFGGTVAGALAAMNATMTRVNGVFEKDLAIHMNLVDNTTIIYTNAASDPYTTMGQWNGQLQTTLTNVVGEANYDVGHMFGASGGGGNAGCIGCVCVNGQKGSGITSPSDAIPEGDTFDIDYVAHELGHQFGGNHSFSQNVEGSGVNVEPGSGSTIMGYAGITSQDVQPHSDDYFVYANIKQIQDNMVGKTCPVRTTLTNVAPVVNAGADYTIPKSTPFILDGTATDADGDALTYCWEQNDSATNQTGANSAASATKTGGPNWRSYTPVATSKRYCPPLARVIANANTTQGAEIVVEALSSVARTLNFVLTARDNYAGAGQTKSDAMLVTVSAAAGPFLVSVPNTAVDWPVGTSQDVTWDVAGTTANNVNAATVDIYLSTDGGLTYPIQLASAVPNDGIETITVPNNIGTTNRIMVKGHNHIFYDISNTNFTISEALVDFTINAIGGTSVQTCAGTSVEKAIQFTTYLGFAENTNFTTSGAPAGSVITFNTNPINATGVVLMSIDNTAGASPGVYPIVVTASSGSIVKTITINFQLFASSFAGVNLTSPANLAGSQATALTLSWTADTNATSYDVEVATDAAFTAIVSTGTASSNSYAISGLSNLTDYYWRVRPLNPSCSGEFCPANQFTTGNILCATLPSANVPLTIATTANVTVNSTLAVTENLTLTDVNVSVNITHSWVNDLTLTLISPAGTAVQLVARPCNNVRLNDINATFDDAGIPIVCANNPAISGTVKPTQVLSAFNGQTSQGTWTLRVLDSVNQDGGSIVGWSLNPCGIQVPLSVDQNSLANFTVFPNPTQGNFTVQFNSDSSQAIQVEVYDLRGRSVYHSNHENTGFINQNIQLTAVQAGVYVLKVKDGTKQVTRKLVIN
ncbi:MAG: proprotein convertase P-domain-containing protein [Flavobacterium sp.]|nr:proprotein convertase P-domain-containing protein [Flavobacterium sp.]